MARSGGSASVGLVSRLWVRDITLGLLGNMLLGLMFILTPELWFRLSSAWFPLVALPLTALPPFMTVLPPFMTGPMWWCPLLSRVITNWSSPAESSSDWRDLTWRCISFAPIDRERLTRELGSSFWRPLLSTRDGIKLSVLVTVRALLGLCLRALGVGIPLPGADIGVKWELEKSNERGAPLEAAVLLLLGVPLLAVGFGSPKVTLFLGDPVLVVGVGPPVEQFLGVPDTTGGTGSSRLPPDVRTEWFIPGRSTRLPTEGVTPDLCTVSSAGSGVGLRVRLSAGSYRPREESGVAVLVRELVEDEAEDGVENWWPGDGGGVFSSLKRPEFLQSEQ